MKTKVMRIILKFISILLISTSLEAESLSRNVVIRYLEQDARFRDNLSLVPDLKGGGQERGSIAFGVITGAVSWLQDEGYGVELTLSKDNSNYPTTVWHGENLGAREGGYFEIRVPKRGEFIDVYFKLLREIVAVTKVASRMRQGELSRQTNYNNFETIFTNLYMSSAEVVLKSNDSHLKEWISLNGFEINTEALKAELKYSGQLNAAPAELQREISEKMKHKAGILYMSLQKSKTHAPNQ